MAKYSKKFRVNKKSNKRKQEKRSSRKGKSPRNRLMNSKKNRIIKKTKKGGAEPLNLKSALELLKVTAVKYLFETPKDGKYTICKKTSLTPEDQGFSILTKTVGEKVEEKIITPEANKTIEQIIEEQTADFTGVFVPRTQKKNIYQESEPTGLEDGEFCFFGLTPDLSEDSDPNKIHHFYLKFNSFNHDEIWTLRFKKITYVEDSKSTPKKNRLGVRNLPPGTKSWTEFFVETDEDDYEEIDFKNFLYELNFGLISYGVKPDDGVKPENWYKPIDVYKPIGETPTISKPGVAFANNIGGELATSIGAHFHEFIDDVSAKKEVDYRKGFMYRHHDGKLRFTKEWPKENELKEIHTEKVRARETLDLGKEIFYENGIVLIQQQYGLQCAVHSIANLLQDPRILLPNVRPDGGDTDDIKKLLSLYGYKVFNNSSPGEIKQITTDKELEEISREPNFIGFIKQVYDHGGHFVSFLRRGEYIYKIDSLNPNRGASGGILKKYTLENGLTELKKQRATSTESYDNLLIVFKYNDKHIKPILVSRDNSIMDEAQDDAQSVPPGNVTDACRDYTRDELASEVIGEAKIIGASNPIGEKVIIQVNKMTDGIEKPRFDVRYQGGVYINVDRMKKVVLDSLEGAVNSHLPASGPEYVKVMTDLIIK